MAALARDRAVRRVSSLTVATAIAGTAASIGFAGLAAVTYTGNANASSASVSQPRVYESGRSNDDNGGFIVPQAVTVPNQIQVAQPPTRTTGRARVTAGGSG